MDWRRVVLALELIIILFHIVEFLYDLFLFFFLFDLLLSLLVVVEFRFGLLIYLVELIIVYYVVLGLYEVNQFYSLGWVLFEHRI